MLEQQNAQLAVGVLVDYLRQDDERRDDHESLRDAYKKQSIWVGELRDKCAEKDREIEELRMKLDCADERPAEKRENTHSESHSPAEPTSDHKPDKPLRPSPGPGTTTVKSGWRYSRESSGQNGKQDDERSEKELAQAQLSRLKNRISECCGTLSLHTGAATDSNNLEALIQCSRNEVQRYKEYYNDILEEYEKTTKELSRLKSSSQWAVTCEGMDNSLAETAASVLKDNTDDPMIKAVPLATKEDGPWVLARYQPTGDNWVYLKDDDSFTKCPKNATRFATFHSACNRDFRGRNLFPVRLSDVKEDNNAEQ